MCLQKTCLSKGHVELGVVNVICVSSVCDGNVTLGVYWGCFTQSTYRFGLFSNCLNIWMVLITSPPPYVKWWDPHCSAGSQMCNLTLLYANRLKALSLSIKRDKVHLQHIATQWQGGARRPWSGNGFTLTDKSGYTQGCPEGQHTLCISTLLFSHVRIFLAHQETFVAS